MSDVAPQERRVAAALAGHTGSAAVARAALSDTDAQVRAAGLRSLARLGRLHDAQLEAALADPAAQVRLTAVELAASRPGPDIADLLDDPDDAVVETTAWACGERPPTLYVVAALIDLCRSHHDPLVREAAVAALGALGTRAGLAAVLAAMDDKPAIRRRAVLALAAFDGAEVDAAWQLARSDNDRQVRDAVEELLGPAELPDTSSGLDLG